MRKKILIVAAVLLLINAVPVSASLYFDWGGDSPQSYWWSFGLGSTYDTHFDSTIKTWLEPHNFSDRILDYNATFVIKSDSGQAGHVPVKIKKTFSLNVHLEEDNATNTKLWYHTPFNSSFIESLDGTYEREFPTHIFLDETSFQRISFPQDGSHLDSSLSYSQTITFWDAFEIGKPYFLSDWFSGVMIWGGSTPINPNLPAATFIGGVLEQTTAFNVVPEPSTMLLLGAGLVGGAVRLRRRATSA